MSGYKDSMYWASDAEIAEWRECQQAQAEAPAQDADGIENSDQAGASYKLVVLDCPLV
ncbi:MAG TPA: hypothetical protein VFD58_15565 [Blastocatellia bacterium]|nr:hypothetical protein [Blastocatellia bacterium]